jgi:hypothetical protein
MTAGLQSIGRRDGGKSVRAAKHAAHARGEVLADPVAGQPPAGTGPPGRTFVCRVWFRAHDDDVLAVKKVE